MSVKVSNEDFWSLMRVLHESVIKDEDKQASLHQKHHLRSHDSRMLYPALLSMFMYDA